MRSTAEPAGICGSRHDSVRAGAHEEDSGFDSRPWQHRPGELDGKASSELIWKWSAGWSNITGTESWKRQGLMHALRATGSLSRYWSAVPLGTESEKTPEHGPTASTLPLQWGRCIGGTPPCVSNGPPFPHWGCSSMEEHLGRIEKVADSSSAISTVLE